MPSLTQEVKVRMAEMLRCLICGRNAWPTSFARGQKHGHSIDSLILNNKGVKRFKWARKNRSRDRDYLLMWRSLLMAHLDRLEVMLEGLGDTFVDAVEPEIHHPPTTKMPWRTFKPWRTVSVLKTHIPKVSYGS